jgi:superoxide dismutase, Cu-Zn family
MKRLASLAIVCLFLAVACVTRAAEPPKKGHEHPDSIQAPPVAETARAARVQKAVAQVHALGAAKVSGTITFTTTDSGVQVEALLTGLKPGKHGFHIHEFGDCSAPDGTSAGGHFNPMAMPHGGPMAKERHMGDMGNLEANAEGKADIRYVDPAISLTGDHSILGRSVIVHTGEDDLKTQPTGNAGAREGCGIIGAAK